MPRSRRRQSPLGALASLIAGLVAVWIFVQIGPALVGTIAKTALTTPAPSGVNWTPADAEECTATARELGTWPDDHGGPVTQLGPGLSDDVVAARDVAVSSSIAFIALADQLRAPGAERQLAQLRAALVTASAAFANPITVTDFRRHYQAIGRASLDLTQQCHAVGRWVDDNYVQ